MNIAANDNEDIDVVRDNVARVVDDVSTTNAELAKELLAAYDRESKLLGGVRKRQTEIDTLKAQLAARDAKLASVEERLERLLRSKAMQVQRAYWKLRRPTGNGPRRDGVSK